MSNLDSNLSPDGDHTPPIAVGIGDDRSDALISARSACSAINEFVRKLEAGAWTFSETEDIEPQVNDCVADCGFAGPVMRRETRKTDKNTKLWSDNELWLIVFDPISRETEEFRVVTTYEPPADAKFKIHPTFYALPVHRKRKLLLMLEALKIAILAKIGLLGCTENVLKVTPNDAQAACVALDNLVWKLQEQGWTFENTEALESEVNASVARCRIEPPFKGREERTTGSSLNKSKDTFLKLFDPITKSIYTYHIKRFEYYWSLDQSSAWELLTSIKELKSAILQGVKLPQVEVRGAETDEDLDALLEDATCCATILAEIGQEWRNVERVGARIESWTHVDPNDRSAYDQSKRRIASRSRGLPMRLAHVLRWAIKRGMETCESADSLFSPGYPTTKGDECSQLELDMRNVVNAITIEKAKRSFAPPAPPGDPVEIWVAAETMKTISSRLFMHATMIRLGSESEYDDRNNLNRDAKLADKCGYLVVSAARQFGLDAEPLLRILREDRLWEHPAEKEDSKVFRDAMKIAERVSAEARICCAAAGIDPEAALTEEGKSTKRKNAEVEEDLSELKKCILIALFNLTAFSSDTKKTTEEVAKIAIGPQGEPASLKEPNSQLKERGFINTRTGRAGGSWLTDKGKMRAESLIALDKR